jgi:hypothetical protein
MQRQINRPSIPELLHQRDWLTLLSPWQYRRRGRRQPNLKFHSSPDEPRSGAAFSQTRGSKPRLTRSTEVVSHVAQTKPPANLTLISTCIGDGVDHGRHF